MSDPHRLKIGLSACFQYADPTRPLFTGKTLQYVEQSIAHWLMSAGAMVVMVPSPRGDTTRGDATLDDYAGWLDGVVMHGGADVWPGNYGEEPMREEWLGDRLRDVYDMEVVKAFAKAKKPIFGVCRGLQLINVAFGGALYQDLQTQHPGAQQHRNAVAYDQHFHEISIVPGTHLAELYKDKLRVTVNSIHHQGIKIVAPEFVVEALSEPDGVPEAIRLRPAPGRGYIAATQWHPEFHKVGGAHTLDDTAILNDFLDACTAAREPSAPAKGAAALREKASQLVRRTFKRQS